ncbi:hypothetical protein Vretifemale_13680, partial [Volvox reticuliferus]
PTTSSTTANPSTAVVPTNLPTHNSTGAPKPGATTVPTFTRPPSSRCNQPTIIPTTTTPAGSTQPAVRPGRPSSTKNIRNSTKPSQAAAKSFQATTAYNPPAGIRLST